MSSIYDDLKSKMLQIIYSGLLYVLQEELNILPASHIQLCTLTIHVCLWEIPRNYFPLYFSKERAYTSEGYRMFAFQSIDVKRDLIKHVLLMYTTVLSLTAYKYAPNLESLLTQQYACIMCTLWSDNTCVFTRFHSVKNANTQLIWSSVTALNYKTWMVQTLKLN
jgi:hypothetical protein